MRISDWSSDVCSSDLHDARSLLPQVETPTLVIAGANDVPVPPEAVRATAAIIPGAASEVVTGAAHQVAMQHPAALADRLCRHISGAPRFSFPMTECRNSVVEGKGGSRRVVPGGLCTCKKRIKNKKKET